MNILGHVVVGIIGTIITQDYYFLIGSILPDIPLIYNELNNRFRKKQFNKWNVQGKFVYDFTHSVYILPYIYLFSPIFLLAWVIHCVIDIPFHTSSFRFNPLMIKRKDRKRCVLLSGGMDSVAAAHFEDNDDLDYIYVNYGQEYHELEYPHAKKYAESKNKELQVINCDWEHDIQNRNYYLISLVKQLGYEEVILGTRNLLPFFDKYKDSNWLNLKILQYLYGIYINMPLIGQFKFQVKNKLKGTDLTYFSSENWNSTKHIHLNSVNNA